MTDQRPCPLCSGTGKIEGPIFQPFKPKRQPRKRPPPPPVVYEPITPYEPTLKRLRSLSENLNP